MDLTAWAQDVVNYIHRHIEAEREVLHAYETLATNAPAGRSRFIVDLIVQDEVRHHSLLSQMANSLRVSLNPRAGTVPSDGAEPATMPLRPWAAELLELEKADLRELRGLRKALSQVEDTRWWATVVGVMELDTKKHISLLKYLLETADEAPPSDRLELR